MKKLLLLSALCLAGMGASAQNLTVTVGGVEVENGATVYSYDADDEYIDEGELRMEPHVVVTSGETANASIEVLNAGVTGMEFCWPQNCIQIPAGKSVTNEGQLKGGVKTDLQIHASTWEYKAGSVFEAKAEITIIVDGSDPFKCTLIMQYPEAGVDGVIADSEAPVYYNLQGVQVSNPENGIFIKKTGNKVTKVAL